MGTSVVTKDQQPPKVYPAAVGKGHHHTCQSDSEDTHGLTPLDPGDSKDGAFKVPQCMQHYFNKHTKRRLTKKTGKPYLMSTLGQTWILESHQRWTNICLNSWETHAPRM